MQTSMATWAKEQLDLAVGQRAAELDAASVGIGRRLKSGRHAPTSSGDSSGSGLDLEAWVARHPLGTLYSAYAQVWPERNVVRTVGMSMQQIASDAIRLWLSEGMRSLQHS